MKIYLFLILSNLFTVNLFCQDSLSKKNKMEVFNSGFIDIQNSGQVASSMRFLKLNIGEPNKFYLPLSIYCGVAGNPIQSNSNSQVKTNEHLVTGFINPTSGLINFSFEDILFMPYSKASTKFGISYQLGARVMHGIKQDTINKLPIFSTVNFVNNYLSAGVYFQTQAWEREKNGDVGTFWISTRFHLIRTGLRQLQLFLPNLSSNGIYTGYSIGFGVHINKSVDLKAIYYNYLKKPEINYYNSLYQFSMNYISNK
jgi:hypothetical protein